MTHLNEEAGEMAAGNERAPGGVPSWITAWLPIIVVAVGALVGYVNTGRDVRDNARDILKVVDDQEREWAKHQDYHREKAAENASAFSRVESRVQALESVFPKMDQLGYRVTVVEQQGLNTSAAIKELQTAVNSQAADLRLALEILRRMDEARPLTTGGPVRGRPPN